jgi:hypothetical protein
MNVKTEPRADVDPVFLKAIEQLRLWALRRHANVASATPQSRWFRIGDADGKAFDRLALGAATSRSALNESLIKSQTGTPAEGEELPTIGAVGDQVVFGTQIDFLSVLERARRAATMTPVRARILAAGRLSGHGESKGVWMKGWLDHIVDLVKRTKG